MSIFEWLALLGCVYVAGRIAHDWILALGEVL